MHLLENEIALAAEYLAEGKYDKIDSAIKNHIAECDDCAHEVHVISQLIDDTKARPRIKHTQRRLVKIAASTAAVLVLGIGGYNYIKNTEYDNDLTVHVDNDQLLAYVENTDLEKLTERFKKGSTRGNHIKVTTSSVVNTNNHSPILTWKNKREELLFIEVLDNKGQQILNDETTGDSSKINLASKGLYYWKLTNENYDLLFCGKIIIK